MNTGCSPVVANNVCSTVETEVWAKSRERAGPTRPTRGLFGCARERACAPSGVPGRRRALRWPVLV